MLIKEDEQLILASIIALHGIFASVRNCRDSHCVLTNLELLVSKSVDVLSRPLNLRELFSV